MSVMADKTADGFTPGPWIIDPEFASEVQTQSLSTIATCWHADAAGQEIEVTGILECSHEKSAANARLISAAPDMYAALKAARQFAVKALGELVELPGFDPAMHVVVKQIDAALLLARKSASEGRGE